MSRWWAARGPRGRAQLAIVPVPGAAVYAPYTLQIVVLSRLVEEARRAERDRLRRAVPRRHRRPRRAMLPTRGQPV